MTSVQQVKRIYFALEALRWFGAGLPLALYILYMQSRGLGLFEIGVVNAVFSLTIILLELPTGGLADTFGRKPITLLSHAFKLGSSLVLIFAFSLPVFAFGFVLFGVSKALASGALNAWFVDSLLALDADIDLQPALAQANTALIVGLSVGTLAGGFIPQLFPMLDATTFLTPLAMIYVADVVIRLALIAITALWVKEDRTKLRQGKAPQTFQTVLKDALYQSRTNPIVLSLLLASLVASLALTTVEVFWQPQFSTWLGDERTWPYSIFMGVAFGLGILGNLASIPLSKLLKKRYGLVAALSQTLSGLAIILLALQTSLGGAAGFFWLYYLGISLSESPAGTLFQEEIPSERRSTMQSVMSLVGYAGGFLSSVLLAYVAQSQSIAFAWLLVGALLALSSLLYLRVERLRQNRL